VATRGTEAPVPSGIGETGRLTLWLAVAAGAVAWSIHLVGSYALVPVACATGIAWILHAVTIATVLPALVGAWYCYRTWRDLRPAAGSSPRGRRADAEQYLGLSGALLNGLFAFAIALEGLPVAIIDPCLGLG
jgi:hypothetical protein